MGPRDRGNIVLERCQMGPLDLTRKQNIEHSMRSVQLARPTSPQFKHRIKRQEGLSGRIKHNLDMRQGKHVAVLKQGECLENTQKIMKRIIYGHFGEANFARTN